MVPKAMRWEAVVPLFVCFLPVVQSIGVVAGIGFAGLATAGYHFMKCQFQECCDEPWIRTTPRFLQQLQENVSHQLYGQPFAKQVMFKALKQHVTDDSPKKPLVMSLHGGGGTGKNHVSEIFARGLFLKGTESSFYTRIPGKELFPYADARSIRQYREHLKSMVQERLVACKINLFVIDEVDKMAPGILDVLTPFFDYHTGSLSVDARSSVFVFLSNTGGLKIQNVMYEAWKKGQSRHDLQMKELEKIINLSAFNENGGFRGSDIMARSMIDHFIPFLPLERKHVKLCIQDHIRRKYMTTSAEQFLELVADQIEYSPRDTQVFARTGCKRVERKVDVLWND